jgi:hypothetical protein
MPKDPEGSRGKPRESEAGAMLSERSEQTCACVRSAKDDGGQD